MGWRSLYHSADPRAAISFESRLEYRMKKISLLEIDIDLVKQLTVDLLRDNEMEGRGDEKVKEIVDRVIENVESTENGFTYVFTDYVLTKIMQANKQSQLDGQINTVIEKTAKEKD